MDAGHGVRGTEASGEETDDEAEGQEEGENSGRQSFHGERGDAGPTASKNSVAGIGVE